MITSTTRKGTVIKRLTNIFAKKTLFSEQGKDFNIQNCFPSIEMEELVVEVRDKENIKTAINKGATTSGLKSNSVILFLKMINMISRMNDINGETIVLTTYIEELK